MKVCIYLSHYHVIGGVETSTFNLCRELSKYHDVTLMFATCEQMQKVLTLPCAIEKYNREKTYYFDTVILESCWGVVPFENINANKFIQIIHADFKALSEWARANCLPNLNHPKITNYVAVSKHVQKVFKEVTGIKTDYVIYNFV